MPNDDIPLSHLIDRVASGQATPEERARLAELVGKSRDMATDVALYQRLLEPAPPTVDQGEALAAAQRIRATAGRGFVHVFPSSSATWSRPWIRLAVAGAMIAVGGAVIFGARSLHVGQPFREFASTDGSRTTVTLRDGTHLVLGPASRLRVGNDFGRDRRVVELEGEALFTVMHDAAHPFAVRTAHAVLRDIGTTFAVQAYADDPETRVAVIEGHVGLDAISTGGVVTQSHPVLSAHEGAVIDAEGGVSVQSDVDVGQEVAWTQGRLVFNKTPLARVVAEVARTFQLTIRIADTSLVARSITASFDNTSADEVLDDITRALGAHYERVGRNVVIRRGTAASAHPATTTAPDPIRLTINSTSLP